MFRDKIWVVLSLALVVIGTTYALRKDLTTCGGDLMMPYGVLRSTNYPKPYPKDLHCVWKIVAPRGHKITLIFQDFALESNNRCSDGDFVAVYDGGNLAPKKVGEYCGNVLPPPFTSSSDKLYIKFRTNGMKELKGFRASFNSSMVCNRKYKASKKTKYLTSLNYPHYYYSSSKCRYRIEARSGLRVKIRFLKFSLEPARRQSRTATSLPPICYDYVQVHDGSTELSPSLGKFCGELQPFSVWSTGNKMLVRFVTDSSVNKIGFRLRFSAEPIPTTAPPSTCRSNEFQCSSGRCINIQYKCDRQDDCGDESDETGCPCRSHQMTCDNGNCLDKLWMCDGSDDCGDWSDERNCGSQTTSSPSNVTRPTLKQQGCNQNNGGCEHTCIDHIIRSGQLAVQCMCNSGYALQQDRKHCADINECLRGDVCDQKCVNRNGTYECECNKGYELLSDKKRCRDINECRQSNGGCAHTCINELGSHRCGCRPGYRLDRDGKRCYDIDECAMNNGGCSHFCIDKRGSRECRCRTGFALMSDRKTCQDIDECALNNGGCQKACQNTIGSFICTCPTGFHKDLNGNCLDIDECMEGIPACFTCVNLPGSFECKCDDPGFRSDANKTRCVDIDECSTNNGGCGRHRCVNTYGSYGCQCMKGYQLSSVGICVDINECLPNKGKGDCEQLCTNTPGSYSCRCYSGFKSRGGGRCLDIDECSSSDTHQCKHNCNNTVGSFFCSCRKGYFLGTDGTSCAKSKELSGFFSDIPGCMGTLIDKEWVVTSALCTHLAHIPLEANRIKVAVGKHHRTISHKASELISVVEVVRHKDFNAEKKILQSNLALLKLGRPVKFTNVVRPICLPTRREVQTFLSPANSHDGVLIGWKIRSGRKYETRLQQTKVNVVHRHHCNWAKRKFDAKRMICAGFQHEEPCISDSGSPLVFAVTHRLLATRWVLGGVLSWGLNTFNKGCHSNYGYSAYANVGRYLKFIRSHVKPKKKGRRGTRKQRNHRKSSNVKPKKNSRKKRNHRRLNLVQRKLRQAKRRRLARRLAARRH